MYPGPGPATVTASRVVEQLFDHRDELFRQHEESIDLLPGRRHFEGVLVLTPFDPDPVEHRYPFPVKPSGGNVRLQVPPDAEITLLPDTVAEQYRPGRMEPGHVDPAGRQPVRTGPGGLFRFCEERPCRPERFDRLLAGRRDRPQFAPRKTFVKFCQYPHRQGSGGCS